MTRADFDTAIAVLRRLQSFAQVRGSNALEEFSDLRRCIGRLEMYRDWWAVPADPDAEPIFPATSPSPSAAARIEELKAEVRSWRRYSRRNEGRAKKAQRELGQIKSNQE